MIKPGQSRLWDSLVETKGKESLLPLRCWKDLIRGCQWPSSLLHGKSPSEIMENEFPEVEREKTVVLTTLMQSWVCHT